MEKIKQSSWDIIYYSVCFSMLSIAGLFFWLKIKYPYTVHIITTPAQVIIGA